MKTKTRRVRRLVTTATLAIAGAAMAGTTASADASTHSCTYGDPPITASGHTSCELAGNAVNEYANYSYCARRHTAWVYSPTTGKDYRLTFRRSGRTVTVTGPRSIWFRFSADPFC